jgi:hypothetical protein
MRKAAPGIAPHVCKGDDLKMAKEHNELVFA